MKWINSMYTYILSSSQLSRLPQSTERVPWQYGRCPLAVHTWHSCVQWIHPTPPHIHTSVSYICMPIPTLQIGSSVPFFLIPYTWDNILYLFFSFWLTWLCMTVSGSTHASTNSPILFLLRAELHSIVPLSTCKDDVSEVSERRITNCYFRNSSLIINTSSPLNLVGIPHWGLKFGKQQYAPLIAGCAQGVGVDCC